MPLFHSYIITDWSGGNRRRGNRPDAIWIAHGGIDAECPEVASPFSRTEAIQLIRLLLEEAAGNQQRVLVCFDFAYGYPVGFAASLQAATRIAEPPWIAVWRYLGDLIEDDLATGTGRKPTNRSNRFDVADQINSLMSVSVKSLGPFWCADKRDHYTRIPQNRPHQPFATAQGHLVKPKRLTDQRARSDTPFRLFGTGSVGSQTLTGIPRLHSLRTDDRLKSLSAVWPFETGWATSNAWLKPETLAVHAEIYPSIGKPEEDTIKDRGQVRSMWKWVRDLDRKNDLWRKFSLPTAIEANSKDDIAIRFEEGWILGCDAAEEDGP